MRRFKQTVVQTLVIAALAMAALPVFGPVVSAAPQSAVNDQTINDLCTTTGNDVKCKNYTDPAACPPGNNDPTCTSQANSSTTTGGCSNRNNCDLIDKFIQPLVNLLIAFVGIAVVIAIVWGGIEYGYSAGDPQKIGAAKKRITNAIFALVTFVFLYALLNFLIPGGI